MYDTRSLHFEDNPYIYNDSTPEQTADWLAHVRRIVARTQAVEKSKVKKKQASRAHSLIKYGMTPHDYECMYTVQEGKCAICGKHEDKLYVDHCHKFNYVRELLCHGCNAGIGFFYENIESLKCAILYLEDHSKDFERELPSELRFQCA